MLYIFDWDGTIMDSAAKIIACMQRAAADLDWDVRDADAIKNIIGLGLPEAMQALYPNVELHAFDSFKRRYASHFVEQDTTPSPLFPGVEETLAYLREQGHQLAVATGKSRVGLERVLTGLGLENFFHGSRCADETASKPHPLMLEELLLEFRVDAEQAVMVGDTEYDMAMAKALNMPRIAVSYGAHHMSRLQVYEPVLCIDEFSRVREYQIE